MTRKSARTYAALSIALARFTASESVCSGDGNLDEKVDQKDRQGVHANNGLSSVFDCNADGITGAADLQILEENFGKVCTP